VFTVYARGCPGSRDRARPSANGSLQSDASHNNTLSSRPNNGRSCLITRPRSLDCVLLTLQSNLEVHTRRQWMHRTAEETSTCPLRRVVSLPNSDRPAPPIRLATTNTTTHAPNHPLPTTTHGSSRCPAVSPGLCNYGQSSRAPRQLAKCHQLAHTRACRRRKAPTLARE
jgi:hypothetical protein